MDPTEDTQPVGTDEVNPPDESDASPSETPVSDETSPDEIDGEPETIADGDTEEEPTPEEREKGYLRDKDYREKTTALANDRKHVEAERSRLAELSKAHEAKISEAENVVKLAAAVLQADVQSIDWRTLAATDPGTFQLKQLDVAERQRQINAAWQSLQGQRTAQTQEADAARQRTMAEQEEKLLESIPEWRDPVKGAAGLAEVRKFANSAGIDDAAFGEIARSPIAAAAITFIRDAMRYRAVQRQLPKPKPVPGAPAPPPKVQGKAPVAKTLENASMDEFMRMRNAQEKRKAR